MTKRADRMMTCLRCRTRRPHLMWRRIENGKITHVCTTCAAAQDKTTDGREEAR